MLEEYSLADKANDCEAQKPGSTNETGVLLEVAIAIVVLRSTEKKGRTRKSPPTAADLWRGERDWDKRPAQVGRSHCL